MTKAYTHRNLIVWRRAQELAHRVSIIVQRMPNSWANAVIARQVISAATSVGANIAEGHGRYTPRAHRNHLYIARGSLAETDSWLDQLRRMGFLTAEEEAPLLGECNEIAAMLTHKILALDRLSDEGVSQSHESRADYVIQARNAPLFPFTDEDYE